MPWTCGYVKGQTIEWQGILWFVNVDCPQGEPGSWPDYTLVTTTVVEGTTGPTGPTGADGGSVVVPYDPGQSGNYHPGQLIYYNGKFYVVNTSDSQGSPGESDDYSEVPGSVLVGPTGPQGPKSDLVVGTYDPNNASNYHAGQLVYYNGKLYRINKDNPSGLPGSSDDFTLVDHVVAQGPTGPTGATGTQIPEVWDPNNTQNYYKGQIIYYNGQLYVVNKDNPQGTPGDPDSDYTLIGDDEITGAPGPDGPATIGTWSPGGTYQKGQIIEYGGDLYYVTVNNPQGVPGESGDYSLINNIYVADGPAGPPGPTGPQGPCSCMDVNTSNAMSLASVNNQMASMANQIAQNTTNLGDLSNSVTQDTSDIADNTDALDNLGDELDDLEDKINEAVNSISYCSCAIGTQIGRTQLDDHGTNNQSYQAGTPTQIGTFFGCALYRQCFMGTITATANDPAQLLPTLRNPARISLLPGGLVTVPGSDTQQRITAVVDWGGIYYDSNCVGVAIGGGSNNGGVGGWAGPNSNGVNDGTQDYRSGITVSPGCDGLQLNVSLNGAVTDAPYYVWVDYIVCPIPMDDFPTTPQTCP